MNFNFQGINNDVTKDPPIPQNSEKNHLPSWNSVNFGMILVNSFIKLLSVTVVKKDYLLYLSSRMQLNWACCKPKCPKLCNKSSKVLSVAHVGTSLSGCVSLVIKHFRIFWRWCFLLYGMDCLLDTSSVSLENFSSWWWKNRYIIMLYLEGRLNCFF